MLDLAPVVAAFDNASRPFEAQWHGLVSTTNWEKGRIIWGWRQALLAAGAGVQEYSDEAWSRRIGNVSSQHVGRLRRVYERFAAVKDQYPGLYWSHFQSALEWPDPELWLEGAVQNHWSVGEMRRQRWQAYGAAAEEQPRDEDLVAAEFDEDAAPEFGVRNAEFGVEIPELGDKADSALRTPSSDLSLSQAPDFGDENPFDAAADDSISPTLYVGDAPLSTVGPFENLPDLPPDLSEAFEMFKLAILRHKLSGWHDVSADDVLSALDALKLLVTAPSE